MSIVGTRPEAIKMAPVVRALARSSDIEQRVLLTGQHRGIGAEFRPAAIRRLDPDHRDLGVGALRRLLRRLIVAELEQEPADLVLVQGDTTSALAGAMAARQLGIPLGHVEAGLRSFDRRQPWPEEGNRVAIDAWSDLLFAPSAAAAANLLSERVSGSIHVTGNSGIDAILEAARSIQGRRPGSGRKPILVTCHRRENEGPALDSICAALKRLVDELPVRILFLLHPNRHRRAAAEARLRGTAHIRLAEPASHRKMAEHILRSWIILTDSGGLQEEGPALGRPVLVMREVTERVEATDNVQLVGTEPSAIVGAVHRLLMDEVRYARMAQPALPFGDGRSGPRIAALIEAWFSSEMRLAADPGGGLAPA